VDGEVQGGNPPKVENLVTEFGVIANGDHRWKVSWESVRDDGKKASSGEMPMELKGNQLIRARAYMSYETNVTELERVDVDTVVFRSAYDGMTFREEIRFLDSDTMRLRQTVGYKSNGDVLLCGQYVEVRV